MLVFITRKRKRAQKYPCHSSHGLSKGASFVPRMDPPTAWWRCRVRCSQRALCGESEKQSDGRAYRQAVNHQCEKSALIIFGKNLNYAEPPAHLPLLPRQGGIHDGSASALQAGERRGEGGRSESFCSASSHGWVSSSLAQCSEVRLRFLRK